MKLKVFDDFPPITKLRAEMGADELGQFELFDPQRQITYSEREKLEIGRFDISSMRLKILKDKTIAFKNTRLWLSWAGHDNYHLAACDQIQKRRHLKEKFIAGVNQPDTGAVCLECLLLLRYDGLDARRSRRLDLTDEIQREFNLTEFQQQYPFFPLV